MQELRPRRSALARLAFAAAFVFGGFALSLGAGSARAAEETPAACALIQGRIVSVGEVREIAASWSAEVIEHRGAAAQAIAVALQAEMAPISEQADALIAFAAEGRVRVFTTDHGCVRDWSVVDAEQWERAVKAALGDQT
jgi:hypothetical protein